MKTETKTYYPNFTLMGDLNLGFDNSRTDRNRIETQIKKFNSGLNGPNVNFPFLDPHPTKDTVFRTNSRVSKTFDQIGLLSHDDRLPTHADHAKMVSAAQGPDCGVFEFGNLFSEAILGRPYDDLTKDEAADFVARFEHKVSDHMPLWIRLPLPVK